MQKAKRKNGPKLSEEREEMPVRDARLRSGGLKGYSVSEISQAVCA
ncbi:hypothetical protein [Pantoea sp.]|nr:hypothetical protein [Pantoea sp.]